MSRAPLHLDIFVQVMSWMNASPAAARKDIYTCLFLKKEFLPIVLKALYRHSVMSFSFEPPGKVVSHAQLEKDLKEVDHAKRRIKAYTGPHRELIRGLKIINYFYWPKDLTSPLAKLFQTLPRLESLTISTFSSTAFSKTLKKVDHLPSSLTKL
ncbi:hypothetical protein T439DRAFT_132974 [Meredithblackwellia eburnea MCA 4105]